MDLIPTDVSDVDGQPYFNLMVYGPPGVGKTRLAATAQNHPLMRNVLFLNHEGGLLSVASFKGVKKIPIKSVGQMEEVFWAITNRKKGYEDIQTVVCDSGTELQSLDLEQTVVKRMEEGKRKNNSKMKDRTQDEIWQEDYGETTARLKRVFRWFKDAPFHFIVTALTKEEFTKTASRDAEPTLKSVGPAFTNKLANSIAGYCDFVWYMNISPETGKRCVLTQAQAPFIAKTRGEKFAPAIGAVVQEPDIAQLYQTMLETEYPEFAKQVAKLSA